jgi:hypothetical protein
VELPSPEGDKLARSLSYQSRRVGVQANAPHVRREHDGRTGGYCCRHAVSVFPLDVGRGYRSDAVGAGDAVGRITLRQHLGLGRGPTWHSRGRDDEVFYVVSRLGEVRIANDVYRREARAREFGPRDIFHTYRNVGDTIMPQGTNARSAACLPRWADARADAWMKRRRSNGKWPRLQPEEQRYPAPELQMVSTAANVRNRLPH